MDNGTKLKNGENGEKKFTVAKFETSEDPEKFKQHREILKEKYKSIVEENLGRELTPEELEMCMNSITLTRMCDECESEISDDYTAVVETCYLCGLKYDLCESCKPKNADWQGLCPQGFGCNVSMKGIVSRP